MKKMVFKLELQDDKDKKKAMKKVSGLPGVESINLDMNDKKLTVTGNVDPVEIVCKLRKLCYTDIVSVGPAQNKKEEPKKGEPKKDNEEKKKDEKPSYVCQHVNAWQAYNNYPYFTPYYGVKAVEEYPTACVIC